MITLIKNTRMLKLWLGLLLAFVAFAGGPSLHGQEDAVAEVVAEIEEAPSAYATFMESSGAAMFTVNNLWILICAALVFLMHLGFSTVESGLCQSKNTVNILFKNVFIVTMGVLTYALWGFNAMYPDGETFNNFFALGGTIPNFVDASQAGLLTSEYADYTVWSDFIFQAMFAATAATIVSGAVAERVKLFPFMIFATLLVMFAYPISGSWKWGAGFLDDMGFYDFAGSSVVHGFGGFAALACVIILGPRKGKYLDNGKVRPILGHSMPLATIGVFLLFLGWFGFNGGSVLSADPMMVSYVFVTTGLGACSGAMGAIILSWGLLKKPDLSMALNGILAGLVGITAGADQFTVLGAVIAGLVAGFLVVGSILVLDRIKIDDPVGAISVHGVCGIWGTLAVGLPFLQNADSSVTMLPQIIGAASICAFAFVFSFIVFSIIKLVVGVRVSEEEEVEGLDIGEHGQDAYADFAPKTH